MKKAIIIIIVIILVLAAVIGFAVYSKKQKDKKLQTTGNGDSNDKLPAKEPGISQSFQKFLNESKPAGASEGDKPSSRSKT